MDALADAIAFVRLAQDVSREVNRLKDKLKEFETSIDSLKSIDSRESEKVLSGDPGLENSLERFLEYTTPSPFHNVKPSLHEIWSRRSWKQEQREEKPGEDLWHWLERIGELADMVCEHYEWYLVQLLAARRLSRLCAPALLEFPGGIRYLCTTMPWTIWPTLVVLWGVCWMFIVWDGAQDGIWEDELDNWTQSDGLVAFDQEEVIVFPHLTNYEILSAMDDVFPVAGTASAIPEESSQSSEGAAIHRPTTSGNSQFAGPSGDSRTEK